MDILSIIIIAVAIIVAIVFLYMAVKNKGLRQVAISLIVEAEKVFEYGKNSEKFNYVFDKMYQLVPGFLQIFFTKVLLVKFIQKVFSEIKIALDYQNTDK